MSSSSLGLKALHHVAIICSDYEQSKDFYSRILGLRVVRETLRAERQSYKLDLALPDGTQIELFSFPRPPPRPSRPEARGLRHLSFAVGDLETSLAFLTENRIPHEGIRLDELTGKRFLFFKDPDDLPLELYEI